MTNKPNPRLLAESRSRPQCYPIECDTIRQFSMSLRVTKILIIKLQAAYFVSFDLCLIAQCGKAEEVVITRVYFEQNFV